MSGFGCGGAVGAQNFAASKAVWLCRQTLPLKVATSASFSVVTTMWLVRRKWRHSATIVCCDNEASEFVYIEEL